MDRLFWFWIVVTREGFPFPGTNAQLRKMAVAAFLAQPPMSNDWKPWAFYSKQGYRVRKFSTVVGR